ncbi:NAD(P)H oxidase [Thermococcus litoralis DSM 5473]|uniref:NAD(P)H oxidase n=2 Tax=Thermococcus litoralis TaxID=2265 RepID=H3ZQ27_THELN|nr:nitroreductase family protein [Thermococcus litoralis]ABV71245.1 NADPH-dependent sulfur oxidoreductase D subunit [Thermococcus litoralis DSM 5473]EHR77918.1 NAD(P)H oxidase [Thermococcus litoralis DSM 5473]
MEFFEVVKKRRSIRRYQKKKVPKECVEKILEAAFYSPSSRNRRPWHFVVVDEEGLIKKLAQTRPALEFLETAPLAIVVCGDEEISSAWVFDASIAAEHIQLAATALGLGACWGHVLDRMHNEERSAEDYVRELLGITDHIRILCVIGIGYPAEEKSKHSEKEVMWERVHWNGFGHNL